MKKILLAAAPLLLLACSSDSLTTPTQESLSGNWNLTAVNGSSLPYVASEFGGKKVEVMVDVLTITPPSTFTEVTTLRNTLSGQVTTQTVTDTGTYDFNSFVVTFHFASNGSIGSGTLSGKKMTVVTSGITFTYKRE